MSHFFISHSHADSVFVEDFVNQITKFNFPIWIDDQICATEEWRVEIDNAIHECFAVILIITESSLNSRYVTYEWSYALGRGKKIIQIAVDKDVKVHPKLEPEQYLRYDDKRFWEKFIDALGKARDGHKTISPEISNAENLLNSPRENDWRDGIERLEDIEDDEAIEALARGLEKKGSAVSLACAIALCEKTEYRDERALPRLVKAMNTSAKSLNLMEKYVITNCLSKVGGETALDALIAAFEDASNPDKPIFLKGIMQINNADNRKFIKSYLFNEDKDILITLIKTINRCGYTDFNNELDLLGKKEMGNYTNFSAFSALLFLEILYALNVVGNESNLEFLGTVLANKDIDYKFRFAAGRAIVSIGGDSAIKTLRRTIPKLSGKNKYKWVRDLDAKATELENAENSKREKFDAALSQVADVEPVEGDEL